MCQQYKSFVNTVRKGFFLLNQKIVSLLVNIFDTISLFAAELEVPKIGIWDKGFSYAKLWAEGVLNIAAFGHTRMLPVGMLKCVWQDILKFAQ